MIKEFSVTVDTIKHTRNPVYTFSTSDWQSLKFIVTVQNDETNVDLTGLIPRIAIKKPDKTTVLQDGEVTDSSNGKCEFTLTSQAYVVGGIYKAEIMLYQGTEKVATTSGFSYTVSIGVMNIDLESSNDWPTLSKAIEAGENEPARISAEANRLTAETTRIQNETTRETNESTREANETVRQTNTATAINNAVQATANANSAAQSANQAATSAETRLTELNGVDTVQLHDRVNELSTSVAQSMTQTPMLSNMLERGWAFDKEDPYTAWVWNNVLYDKETDEIVLIYHSKKDHGGSGGRLLMRRLKNGVFSEYTVVGEVAGRGCVTSGSQLLANGKYAMIVKETEGGVNTTAGVFFYKSTDKGKTWTKNEILIDGAKITPRDVNDCYQTNSGRILTNCTLSDGLIYTLYSDDEGATWNKTLMQNNSGKVDPLEGKYMQLSSGTIIIVMRASTNYPVNGVPYGGAEPALFSKSTDNGLTWTPLILSTSILDMTGNNCAILKNDNSIELFYASRHKADGVNCSLFHSITTHDEAEKGNFGTPVKIANGTNDGWNGDFGYPGVAKDKNGYVHLFYYDKDTTGTNVKYMFGKYYDYNGSIKDVEYTKDKHSLVDVSRLLEAILENDKAVVSKVRDSIGASTLYSYGDEKHLYTGGWVKGWETGTSTKVKNTNSFQLTASGDNGLDSRSSYIPANGIDVTNIKYIFAELNVTNLTGDPGIASASISVYNKKYPTNTTDGRILSSFFTVSGTGIIQLDVSSLSGVVYPAIMANKGNSGLGSIDFKCYKVWVEYTNNEIADTITNTISSPEVLYEAGNEKVWVTNGWVTGWEIGTGGKFKNKDSLRMTVWDTSTNECKRSYIPNNGIDVTNLNSIKAIVNIKSLTGNAGVAAAGLLIYNKKVPLNTNDGRLAAGWATTLGISTITVDVSALTGIVYPAIMASKGNVSAGSIDLNVYKVWAE